MAFTQVVQAQSAGQSEKLIYELSESDFLKRYKQYRTETEKHAAFLKLKADSCSDELKIEMKSAYKETQDAFHSFIYSIRNDLLDSKKRRYIKKETELYIETKLLEVDEIYQEYYRAKFHPIYMQVCHPEMASRRTIDPSLAVPMIVSMLPTIVATFTKLADFFDDNKEEKLEAFKKLLDEEWVQPHLFEDWEQI
jgi:hypothetical protein